MKTKIFTLIALFFIFSAGIFAQVNILNFEDEDETAMTIADLHTSDWQTNTNYTRNTYTLNPQKTGVDQTDRCASFSGYNSDNEWWYGFDIVLANAIPLTSNLTYLHAAMMTNNTNVDTNRGLLLRSSDGGGTDLKETWVPITDHWADYVFPIPSGATDIYELRFMFNHKISGEITYLDEIVINNDPNPRTLISTGINVPKSNPNIKVYSVAKNIMINSYVQSNNVEVFDMQGKRIFNQSLQNDYISVPVAYSGIYLVRINNSSYKVVVR